MPAIDNICLLPNEESVAPDVCIHTFWSDELKCGQCIIQHDSPAVQEYTVRICASHVILTCFPYLSLDLTRPLSDIRFVSLDFLGNNFNVLHYRF